MKIQYASDLHLEFKENSNYLKQHPLTVSEEILVLAGDIGYIGDDNYSKHPFWDWASENYKQVIVVPGNHDPEYPLFLLLFFPCRPSFYLCKMYIQSLQKT